VNVFYKVILNYSLRYT